MSALGIVGKVAFLIFWLAVLVNLTEPFAYPFHPLLNTIAVLVLILHLIEAVSAGARTKGRPHPWLDRFQILLFGIFHWVRLPVAASTTY
jgi:putative membrane protein